MRRRTDAVTLARCPRERDRFCSVQPRTAAVESLFVIHWVLVKS